jgi:hypothetical protein
MFLSNEPTVAYWLRLYLYGIDGSFPSIQEDMKPNNATAPNAAMTLRFQIERDWRGIGEPQRSAHRDARMKTTF